MRSVELRVFFRFLVYSFGWIVVLIIEMENLELELVLGERMNLVN